MSSVSQSYQPRLTSIDSLRGIAALCITAFVDIYIRTYHPAQVPVGQDNSLFTFGISLLSIQGLAAPYFGSNGVFWTLALELHFYAIYPILFFISRRYGPVKALSLTLGASLLYITADFLFGLSNLLPYRGAGNPIFIPYWFTWSFGFYLAEVEVSRAVLPRKFWLIATIGMILAISASFFKFYNLTSFSTTLALGGLLYWSVSVQGNHFWSCWFGRLLARVGIFSYSLYAVHIPYLLILKVSILPLGKKFTTLIPVLITSVFVIVAAWLLFLLVERWTLRPLELKRNSR